MLDKELLAQLVKNLRKRRIFFLIIKLMIYLVILISGWLFLSGEFGDIFLIFLVALLSLFMLNADYQLKKWFLIIQTLQKETI